MIKVKNRGAVRTLSQRSLRSAGKRNLVAILAIILTTVMFTGLLTIGMSLVDYIQEQNMRRVGTTAHGGFKCLTQRQYDKVTADSEIKDISFNIYAGSAQNMELKKLRTEVRYYEEDAAKWGFCYPEEGHMPQNKGEIACGSAVLEALGLPCQLGTSVPLVIESNGKTYTETFKLCGFWKTDPIIPANEILLSREDISRIAPTPTLLAQDQQDPTNNVGYLNATFFFSTSWDIENQVEDLTRRCGLPKETSAGVNWSYGSSSINPDDMIVLCGVMILFLAAGYLIIYNIFAISVSRDIHFYGLLKTVGTTGRQIKGLVHRQAFLLALIGIPMGLALGWAAGKYLMPAVFMGTSYAQAVQAMKVSAAPEIFFGGTIFSFITVWISCLKPCKTAARVSPVDAVRWTEGDSGSARKHVREKKKKSRKVSPFAMALANLHRTPVKTIIVVLSLMLSLTLLNAMVTLLEGYDEEKYIDGQIPCDYILTDYTIAQFSAERNLQGISRQLMEQVAEDPGVESMGATYFTDLIQPLSPAAKEKAQEFLNYLAEEGKAQYLQPEQERLDENQIWAGLYGVDGLVMEKLNINDGTLDQEKFLSGDYIIISAPGYDDWKTSVANAYYQVGDKVKVNLPDGTGKDYEVLAIGRLKTSLGSRSNFMLNLNIILPASEYLAHAPAADLAEGDSTTTDSSPAAASADEDSTLGAATNDSAKAETEETDACGVSTSDASGISTSDASEIGAMTMAVNCTDDRAGETLGAWLEAYCENSYSTIYESRETVQNEFKSMSAMIVKVGGSLAAIMGLIALLNFINSMVTSIYTRQRELAMLQSVGMTRSQMKKMLIGEGVCHILLGGILAALFSLVFCAVVGAHLEESTSFFTWHPVIWPIAVSTPILLALAAAVPALTYHFICKQTIVERLRQTE